MLNNVTPDCTCLIYKYWMQEWIVPETNHTVISGLDSISWGKAESYGKGRFHRVIILCACMNEMHLILVFYRSLSIEICSHKKRKKKKTQTLVRPQSPKILVTARVTPCRHEPYPLCCFEERVVKRLLWEWCWEV